MTALVDDVLTLGWAEAGRLTYEPQPMDLAGFCRELIDEFQLGIGAQHRLVLELVRSEQKETMPVVMDPQILHHILANLLSNAIKYSPIGSQVRLTVRMAGEQAIFQVADEGIGIPAADLPRLFEPFHRAGNVGVTLGTGLGLSIVKRMVELCGGTTEVASEEGRGSTFTVALPAHSS